MKKSLIVFAGTIFLFVLTGAALADNAQMFVDNQEMSRQENTQEGDDALPENPDDFSTENQDGGFLENPDDFSTENQDGGFLENPDALPTENEDGALPEGDIIDSQDKN